MLNRLHHIGLVVESVERALPGYLQSVGAEALTPIIHDPLQKAKVLFLRTSPQEPVLLELVEPAGENSPVRQFLEKKGGGFHHLCYEVDNIQTALDDLRARKAVIVSRPKPAVAFNGRPVAWIMTREWLLVELLEGRRERGALL